MELAAFTMASTDKVVISVYDLKTGHGANIVTQGDS